MHLFLVQRYLTTYVSPTNEFDDLFCTYTSRYWNLHCKKVNNWSKIEEFILNFLFEGKYFHNYFNNIETTLQNFNECFKYIAKIHAIFSTFINPLFAVFCFGFAEVFEKQN